MTNLESRVLPSIQKFLDNALWKNFITLSLDDNGSGDTIGVLFIIFLTTVFEGDLFHKLSGERIIEGIITVILRFQHEQLPDFIEVLDILSLEFVRLDGLSDEGGD